MERGEGFIRGCLISTVCGIRLVARGHPVIWTANCFEISTWLGWDPADDLKEDGHSVNLSHAIDEDGFGRIARSRRDGFERTARPRPGLSGRTNGRARDWRVERLQWPR